MLSKALSPQKLGNSRGLLVKRYQSAAADRPRTRPTHILKQPARPLGERNETILIQKEQDDQTVLNPGWQPVEQANENDWVGHNVYLKQLLLNKHYAHGFDYWKTIRKHGPKPNTLSYNLYFALVEAAGSPYDIIDTFYDFDDTNVLRVDVNPDATCFAYLVKAHCTLKDYPAVTAVLERMKDLKIEPTQRTYAIILDLLSDLNEFEKGEKFVDEVREKYTNAGIQLDIELMNALLYFYGSKDIEEGEKFFQGFIRDGVKTSYNTYQRLIELYVKHKRPVDVGRIVYLMKNDGLKPDQELTKYTLFQGYIETGDPAILKSIRSSYERETFQRTPHYKFYYDFISKYIDGGGPVYIPEGYLEIATEDELEKLYVQCVSRELKGEKDSFRLDKYGSLTFDLNKILKDDDNDEVLDDSEAKDRLQELLPNEDDVIEFPVAEGELQKIEKKVFGQNDANDEESDYSYAYEYEDEIDINESLMETNFENILDGDQDPIAMNQGKKKDALPTGKRRKLKLPKLPRLEDDKPDDGEYPYQDDDPQRYKEIMNQISLKQQEIRSRQLEEKILRNRQAEEERAANQQAGLLDEENIFGPESEVEDSVKFPEEQLKEMLEGSDNGEEVVINEDFIRKLKGMSMQAPVKAATPVPDPATLQKNNQKKEEEDLSISSAPVRTTEEIKALLDEEVQKAKAHESEIGTDDKRTLEAAKVLFEVSKYDTDNQDFLEKHPNWEEEVSTLTKKAQAILEGKSFPESTPAKGKAQGKASRAFKEKLQVTKGDSVAKEIETNPFTVKNVDKFSAGKREPTEAELHKAYVRRTYLKKIKTKFNEAKQRNASPEELEKIRATFEKVKTSKITEREVDNYDHRMGLYLSKLQFENPKLYKGLYAEYRMDMFGDRSHFNDPALVEHSSNPLEVMDAQFSAIDEFYEEQGHVISDDNIFIEAVRQFDHKNPEDPEMKRLVLQWGKNQQEQQFQNLDEDMLRTRMASINVLLPNAPMRKPTGHPEDTFWNEPDDPEDHNYI